MSPKLCASAKLAQLGQFLRWHGRSLGWPECRGRGAVSPVGEGPTTAATDSRIEEVVFCNSWTGVCAAEKTGVLSFGVEFYWNSLSVEQAFFPFGNKSNTLEEVAWLLSKCVARCLNPGCTFRLMGHVKTGLRREAQEAGIGSRGAAGEYCSVPFTIPDSAGFRLIGLLTQTKSNLGRLGRSIRNRTTPAATEGDPQQLRENGAARRR